MRHREISYDLEYLGAYGRAFCCMLHYSITATYFFSSLHALLASDVALKNQRSRRCKKCFLQEIGSVKAILRSMQYALFVSCMGSNGRWVLYEVLTHTSESV
jgi:hypothetical protein